VSQFSAVYCSVLQGVAVDSMSLVLVKTSLPLPYCLRGGGGLGAGVGDRGKVCCSVLKEE